MSIEQPKPKTKISTKERAQQIKAEQEKGPRQYGNLDIDTMIEAGIGPFDLFDLTKKHPIIKDYPIDITWKKLINLHNALLKNGPKINGKTLYAEAMEVMGKVFEKIFLAEDSVKQ